MVCRNDEPGGTLGARFTEHILERLGVIFPIVAFLVIGIADLPLARRIVQSLLEAPELFLLGNVQEKLRMVVLFSVAMSRSKSLI